MAHLERIIVLVDMDCFYCQVEEKLNPEIKNQPIAVVQYNAWRGGGIIAVNYPAREKGVTRSMRGDEAQQKCPNIVLCRVPNVRGKADLSKYREAGKDVAAVLQKFTPLLQRASIDEAYLDITESVNKKLNQLKYLDIKLTPSDLPNTFVYGTELENFLFDIYNERMDDANWKLAIGGTIVEEVRAAVLNETGFKCSAGIAHNKVLAKLACGMNKPNKQTILSHDFVPKLYSQLPVHKIKSLGGKFGETLSEDLNITYMGELSKFSEKTLQQKYDLKNGTWLYNIARGIDNEPVTLRLCPKSIGCCKRFPGKTSLNTSDEVKHWLGELANEVYERLQQDLAENNRKAKNLIISYSLFVDKKSTTYSKSIGSCVYDADRITLDALEIIQKANPVIDSKFKFPVTYLGISAGKFEENQGAIRNYFVAKTDQTVETTSTSNTNEANQNLESVSISNFNETKNHEDENVEKDKKYDGDIEKNVKLDKNQLNIKSFFSNKSSFNTENQEVSCDEKCDDIVTLEEKPFMDDKVQISDSNSTEVSDGEVDTSPNNTYKCDICKKNIPSSDIETHSDYHLALQLASYENETPNSTLNKSPETKTTSAQIGLKNLFKSSNLTTPTTCAEKSDEISEICDQCQQKIPLSNFLEHLDYHEAKKLHQEINKIENDQNKVKHTSSSSTIEVNKKRSSTEESTKISKKMKPITNFFKPL